MPEPLTEPDREQILAELTEAHNAISKLLSDLRRRYSAKSPALKAAAKAERDLSHLNWQNSQARPRESTRPLSAASSDQRRKGHRPRAALTSPPAEFVFTALSGRFFDRLLATGDGDVA